MKNQFQRLFLILFSSLVLLPFCLDAQTDTTRQNSLNLLDELNMDKDTVQLLPERILFTQAIFWGKKGLMRNLDYFKLTPDNRARELKLRRYMLKAHQTLGFATLLGMIAQGVVGSQLYKEMDGKIRYRGNLRSVHENLAMAVNIGYFTTAGLSLLAPPRMVSERKGYSSIKLHKILAIIHLSSMIATNVLAGQLEGHPDMRKWHRAAAFTAFGTYAAAMVVIKF
ncbi:MAG: hypothetical protein NTU44_08890 [Bacteroidetes bacterium]|nr:hypothetical protein [Bacteroidota bacterium]